MSGGVDSGQVLTGVPFIHQDAANGGGSVVCLVGVAEVERPGRRENLRVVVFHSVAKDEPVSAQH